MSALPDMPDPHRRGILRWLWRGYVRAHGGTLVLALLFMMLEGAMLGALSWLIQPMFDEIFSAGRAEAIPLVGLAIAGVFAVRAVSAFAHTVLTARIGQRVSAKLQTNMLGHMLRLDSAWFQRHPPGLLIERMRGDTTTVSNLWEVVLAGFARDLVSVLALLGVALSIDWRWTLLVVAAAPVLVLPIGLLQRGVRVTSRGARERAARIATRLDEAFHGIDTIKLSGTEDREEARIGTEINGFVRAHLRAIAGRPGSSR